MSFFVARTEGFSWTIGTISTSCGFGGSLTYAAGTTFGVVGVVAGAVTTCALEALVVFVSYCCSSQAAQLSAFRMKGACEAEKAKALYSAYLQT